MSINKYQRVRIRPKNEVETDQKQTRSRPDADQKQTRSRPEADQKQTRSRQEADQKRKWKQTRSKLTGIGILNQPKI